MFTAAIQGSWGASRGGPVTRPAPSGWSVPALTPGDGTMTLDVIAPSPALKVYARYRPFLSTGPWSAEVEAFSRTGSGAIVITGLTNEVYREFIVYTKNAQGATSDWSEPRYGAPSAGGRAVIDEIMEAVAAELAAMGLTSLDEEGATVALTGGVEIPPLFEEVTAPCYKVFPDTEEGEAGRNEKNTISYRVDVAFCQRSKTTPQRQEQFRVRELIRDHFLGRRLIALPSVICAGEGESGVLDMPTLWERFQWVSVITLEFSTRRPKG